MIRLAQDIFQIKLKLVVFFLLTSKSAGKPTPRFRNIERGDKVMPLDLRVGDIGKTEKKHPCEDTIGGKQNRNRYRAEMSLLWQEGIGAQSKGGKKHKTYHKKD